MADKENTEPTKLNAIDLLGHFRTVVEGRSFRFIRHVKSKRLLTPVDKLIKHLNAENWHGAHEAGLDLWQQLMSAAIRDVDPTGKGNSALYAYVDDAIKFEDLLYGLEEFYRDHTLHSLWVYLIGVKLMDEEEQLRAIGGELDWYLRNDVEEAENPDLLVAWAKLYEEYINSKVSEKRDAIWCIMALCHDLGYSLAKLPDLNRHVENVLKHYHVSTLQRVGYSLSIEHKYLADQFIDLMAMDVRITPNVDGSSSLDESKNGQEQVRARRAISRWIQRQPGKRGFRGDDSLYDRLLEDIRPGKRLGADRKMVTDLAMQLNNSALTKCYRDDASYWRLCKALERKEHGILSAYLIYKTLGIFAETYVRGSAEEWGLHDGEEIYDIIRGNILFGIAQHEFAFAHIANMSSLAEILILCDELEEFSRLGRQLLSRDYHPTTANTSVQIAPDDKEPNWLTIHMIYESVHPSPEEFAEFWIRKAERLCQLFSLPSLKKEEYEQEKERGKNLIRSIRAEFSYTGKNKSRYNNCVFVMRENRACSLEILGGKRRIRIPLECRDDKLHLVRRQNQPPLTDTLLLKLLLKPRAKKVEPSRP